LVVRDHQGLAACQGKGRRAAEQAVPPTAEHHTMVIEHVEQSQVAVTGSIDSPKHSKP